MVTDKAKWISDSIKRIDEGKEEGFFRTRNVICPWCGKETKASSGEIPPCENRKCDSCGKQYSVSTHTTTEYTTVRLRE